MNGGHTMPMLSLHYYHECILSLPDIPHSNNFFELAAERPV
jgi:hypothetical protein